LKKPRKQAAAFTNQASDATRLIEKLQVFIQQHCQQAPSAKPFLLLAFSGGLDSTVLLHLLVSLQKILPVKLHAMHVHHGLSEHADAWLQFCQAQCATLDVPLHVTHVQVDRQHPLGIEAAARTLRYQALMDFADNGVTPDFIVTAHHQQDQAETLLLQLFRGAGVKGLASMASVDSSRRLLRPLLDVSQQALKDYALTHQLSWCDDDSNTNTDYERNFLRHAVLPIIQTRHPAIHTALARAASHFAEAQQLLEEIAVLDAESLVKDNVLCLQGLAQLDQVRAKNLVRWWLANNQLKMPTTEHLTEMLTQLLHAKSDAQIHIVLQDYTLKRYQQQAYLWRNQPSVDFDLLWQGEPSLLLPNGGKLLFNQVLGVGLAVKHGVEKLRITNRKGGERFKPHAARPTRTLKHLLQEANIPPWQRENLPLIYWHDTLAYVPTIGVAHELVASQDELGVEVSWQESVSSRC
jgi:tRNA(Ile)-lysidine synthase